MTHILNRDNDSWTSNECKRIIPTTGPYTRGPTVQEYDHSKYQLVYKQQQSSFASAEGVVPIEENPSRSIL